MSLHLRQPVFADRPNIAITALTFFHSLSAFGFHRLHFRVIGNALSCRHAQYGRPAFRAGGDEGNRTPDPLLAKQVLSQLSYTPKCVPPLDGRHLSVSSTVQ